MSRVMGELTAVSGLTNHTPTTSSSKSGVVAFASVVFIQKSTDQELTSEEAQGIQAGRSDIG